MTDVPAAGAQSDSEDFGPASPVRPGLLMNVDAGLIDLGGGYAVLRIDRADPAQSAAPVAESTATGYPWRSPTTPPNPAPRPAPSSTTASPSPLSDLVVRRTSLTDQVATQLGADVNHLLALAVTGQQTSLVQHLEVCRDTAGR